MSSLFHLLKSPKKFKIRVQKQIQIQTKMYDIIIKNGTIIDGSGKPMFLGDVGIRGDEIAIIGNIKNDNATTIIDAENQYVAPGFIDVNNHSDTFWRIFSNPDLESLIYQGITTIIGGNCGSSLAPLVNKDIIQSIQKWTDIKKMNLNWLTTKEFLDEVGKKPLSVNFATLVGHGTLRRGIIKDEVRNPSDHEIKMMKKMLRMAMKQGAIGMSTGLVYTHAKMATEKEIEELAKVVKEYDGVYATHIRGEGRELIESIKEAIDIGKKTGVKLQISHLKAMGEKSWPLMNEAIDLIETARNDGLNINFDIYPYTATGSVLYIFLPDWITQGGKKMMIRRLKDPEIRKKVIEEMKADEVDYSGVIIAISPLNKTLTRKSIADIAISQEKSVEETVLDVLIASDGRVVTFMNVLSEKNVVEGIKNPFSMITSNGSGYNLEYENNGDLIHPRNFGSFPRVLAKYVREKKILSWEEAIHKISGGPAEKFNLQNRGVIKEGNFADVVVFDPKKIQDLATPRNPYQYSQGITQLIVNGKIVLEQGKYNGHRAGIVLKKTSLF
jgi:N-acyl-D-amino-acid deacylase